MHNIPTDRTGEARNHGGQLAFVRGVRFSDTAKLLGVRLSGAAELLGVRLDSARKPVRVRFHSAAKLLLVVLESAAKFLLGGPNTLVVLLDGALKIFASASQLLGKVRLHRRLVRVRFDPDSAKATTHGHISRLVHALQRALAVVRESQLEALRNAGLLGQILVVQDFIAALDRSLTGDDLGLRA